MSLHGRAGRSGAGERRLRAVTPPVLPGVQPPRPRPPTTGTRAGLPQDRPAGTGAANFPGRSRDRECPGPPAGTARVRRWRSRGGGREGAWRPACRPGSRDAVVPVTHRGGRRRSPRPRPLASTRSLPPSCSGRGRVTGRSCRRAGPAAPPTTAGSSQYLQWCPTLPVHMGRSPQPPLSVS